MTSVFAKYEEKNWPYRFAGTLHFYNVAGGVPYQPDVQRRHLEIKTGAPDDLIRKEIAGAMVEQGMTVDEAVEKMSTEKGHIGFRKDDVGLYVGGYQLKACLREAASIACAAGRLKYKGWGVTSHSKAIQSWMAEHVFVVEHRLYLNVTAPSQTDQSFISKVGPKGPTSAIQYTDVVEDAKVDFTVETDWDFSEAEWGAIWTTAQKEGMGAARKMGYGEFDVVRWDRVGDSDRDPR